MRIGTRGSVLALRQAEWVAGELRRLHGDVRPELVVIKTRGDKIVDVPLREVGGKGLFVKEIEDALLTGEVDVAVHSLKDVPVEQPAGLCLAALPERVDPRDALIGHGRRGLRDLREGAVVGTGSLRRTAQLRHARPDLQFAPLRGNVDTRLRKLHAGQVDAIVLAAAGLVRLGKEHLISEWISLEVCTPAAGQGILGLQTRDDDRETRARLEPLESPESRACAEAERRVVAVLGGSCQVPIGALGLVHGPELELAAVVSDLAGERLLRAAARGRTEEPIGVADSVVNQLREMGAEEILSEITGADGSRPAPG